jgi:hypothetical protein
VTVKSIPADIRDSDTDFHGGKEIVLYDITFRYWKFHVVKELKLAYLKNVT